MDPHEDADGVFSVDLRTRELYSIGGMLLLPFMDKTSSLEAAAPSAGQTGSRDTDQSGQCSPEQRKPTNSQSLSGNTDQIVNNNVSTQFVIKSHNALCLDRYYVPVYLLHH